MLTINKLLFRLSLSQWISMVALFVGVLATTYLETQTKVTVQVPRDDLPAYHLVQPSDLISRTYAVKDIPRDAFKKTDEIKNRYTLTNISKHKPLTKKLLSSIQDSIHVTDTVAIGIPATPAMTLGASLQAGDIIDITVILAKGKAESAPSTIVFPNILVLDVKQNSQTNATFSSVIVIAIPSKRQPEFALHSISATILVSRKL
jgi:Flp pilus assembly protein CpaB